MTEDGRQNDDEATHTNGPNTPDDERGANTTNDTRPTTHDPTDSQDDDATITHQDASTTTPDEATMSRDTTSTEESDDGRFNRIRSRPAVGLAVVLAVVAGLVVAPSVYGAVTGPDGTVAVVEIDGSIDSATAQHVEDNLREARNNDSIEAVVLEVDSGGGLPAQSERMYAAVDRTASVMPVIATVDTLGASGAYLAIAPADKIYVAPPHKQWECRRRRHRAGTERAECRNYRPG